MHYTCGPQTHFLLSSAPVAHERTCALLKRVDMSAISSDDDSQTVHELNELLSRSSVAIQRVVRNPIAQQHLDIGANILHDIRNAVTLLEISSDFHKSLRKVDQKWVPKGAIEFVRDCCNQRYKEYDVEGIFFRQAGTWALESILPSLPSYKSCQSTSLRTWQEDSRRQSSIPLCQHILPITTRLAVRFPILRCSQ
jgi:hypothetical protein